MVKIVDIEFILLFKLDIEVVKIVVIKRLEIFCGRFLMINYGKIVLVFFNVGFNNFGFVW